MPWTKIMKRLMTPITFFAFPSAHCSVSQQKRQLWAYLNIAFNRVDEDRLKLVGADRACAEWLLRNGGAVKFMDDEEITRDYNALPAFPPGRIQFVQEIDATDSAISHHGFDHLKGCNHVNKIILHRCVYLEDEALEKLTFVKKTLQYLQISSCGNISEKGILAITSLSNLTFLKLYNLPEVKNRKDCEGILRHALKSCKVEFKLQKS